MLNKKTPLIFYKIPAIIFAMAILYLAVVPIPQPPIDLPLSDKISHLGAFLVLGFLLALPIRKSGTLYLWTLILPISYGVLIELVQSQLPNRTFELLDILADVVGASIAYLVAFFIIRYRKRSQNDR